MAMAAAMATVGRSGGDTTMAVEVTAMTTMTYTAAAKMTTVTATNNDNNNGGVKDDNRHSGR